MSMREATVVLGVDFSSANERALDAAIKAAKDWKAKVILVHAMKPLAAPGLDLSHPAFDPVRNEAADVTAAAQPALAQSWMDRIGAAGLQADLVYRSGPAAEVIIDEANRRQARAIVVGTHGRTGMEKAVLGSVAKAVLAKSPIPVLVVPGVAAAA
jgi:nucleotide-binding universal stress UspA family protein